MSTIWKWGFLARREVKEPRVKGMYLTGTAGYDTGDLRNGKMKILHFLSFFPPHTKGGSEIFLLNLARSQIERGHKVQIICPNVKEEIALDCKEGIRVTHFPFPYGETDKNFLAGIRAHRTCEGFSKIVDGIAPDVIHLHGLYPHFLKYFENIQETSQRNLVLTVHLVNIVCPNQTLVNYRDDYCEGKVDFEICSRRISSSKGTSKVSRIVNSLTIPVNSFVSQSFGINGCISQIPNQRRVASQIRVLNFLRNRVWIEVLNPWFYQVFAVNGFSTRRLSYFDSPLFHAGHFSSDSSSPPGSAKVRFLFVGRVSVQKGVEFLLQTLEQLEQVKDRFSVTFVGRHADMELNDRVRRLVQRGFALILAGEIENDAMPLQYHSSDYLLFPSARASSEMLPLVIQEALESELPVVSSDIPAARALINNGVNGYLFRADDKCHFSAVLGDIIQGRRALRFKYVRKPDSHPRYAYYDAIYQRALTDAQP